MFSCRSHQPSVEEWQADIQAEYAAR